MNQTTTWKAPVLRTKSPLEQFIAETACAGAVRGLKHIKHYEREPSGAYRWFYTGDQLFIRATPEICQQWAQLAGDGAEIELTINDALLGVARLWIPYAYPRNFLLIELAEKWQYRPEVVLRLAQFGGMDTSSFDKKLLEITQYLFDPDAELVF